jgi:uncharacterized membrane protein
MADLVLGVFNDRVDAEDAIDELKDIGYNAKDISIVMRDSEEGRAISHSTGASVADSAVTGATTGGVIGGLAGLLIGIGAIAIPGVGAILIGGPLAAALGLTGAAATTVSGAVTGALAGGLVGALVGIGVPEEDARVYEESVSQGAILVAVPVSEGRTEEARTILEDNGAQQVRAIETTEHHRRHFARY